MPRVLLSVADKSGLVDFAMSLVELGWDLVATDGTEMVLRSAGLSVVSVEQVTGFSEMLGGRVKTLHPAIFGGILARSTASDIDALRVSGFAPIGMVVCNLYSFQDTVAALGVALQDAIEQIDVGGVSMLRAAAKNFLRVVVVTSVNDYAKIIAGLKAAGEIDLATRRSLAVKAFAMTRDYDTAIHAFLSQDIVHSLSTNALPQQLSIGMQQVEALRYGENPHQVAGFYSRTSNSTPLGGRVLGGKQLSYNNILDLDAAWKAVSSFSQPTAIIVKHLNPTGIASADTIANAYSKALASDPISAFGGVIAVNQTIEDDFVEALGSLFIEAIAAPAFSPSAQTLLLNNRKNCRLIEIPQPYSGREFDIRSVHGGLLVQSSDIGDPEGTILTTVTTRQPSVNEIEGLQFAWKAVQHVKSNAIVIAIAGATIGIGGGLSSRVDAAQLAVAKAGQRAKGAVMASDAFFPFADGLEVAIKAGVTAVIQPGGSIRDNEVIEAANQANIAMLFTGARHFRH